ncbi:tRNA1(Val) A37 N6-methylase TrmN6 [Desulfitispora alkaliphila]|uniref:tRNA (mnm(5)s(2)U34)-methyltransferase n=1 Tax=Desulfitispora alkaliphila TaxID=622674 RepID=UPI003D2053A4
MNQLNRAVDIAHLFTKQAVKPGGTVVDCTAGNGHDTVLLAELVEDAGKVYAFDIQKVAIENTEQNLRNCRLLNRVKLIHASHHEISKYITEPVDFVIFNLGYLPGADKEIITKAETTLDSLHSVLTILKPGGMILFVVYPGHAGGANEAKGLLEFTATIDKKLYNVIQINHQNRKETSPFVLIIESKERNDSP